MSIVTSKPIEGVTVQVSAAMIRSARLRGWTGAELLAHAVKESCELAGIDPGRIEVEENGHRAVIPAGPGGIA